MPSESGGGSGNACGSLNNPLCDDGEYCQFPPSAICGAADAPGKCAEVPEVCDEIYKPVCGCDDKTYPNACYAARASVSVVHDGACDATGPQTDAGSPGAFCGGIAGIQCAEGQFCSFAPSARCGAGDQSGTCAVKPEACTAIYDPVCGCDGKTYGNACSAASAGVSVQRTGACTP